MYVVAYLLSWNDVARLRTLGAVFGVERNFLAFGQYFEAFCLDSGEVYKHVFTAV